MDSVGFVGLGNMGSVLAGNLVHAGHDVVAHDALGPERAPEGTTYVSAVADVAQTERGRGAEPAGWVRVGGSGAARSSRSPSVARRTSSTPRPSASRRPVSSDALLAAEGIAYVDAPVSGGVAGARARTLTVMYAGHQRRVHARRTGARRAQRPSAIGSATGPVSPRR